MDIPSPSPDALHLADVVPAVLAAMGVAGAQLDGVHHPIDLPAGVRGACVLLIDGLGAQLLDTYADDAPVLAGLRGRTVRVGYPSTTAAGLAAVGTGRLSGEHGMVGYSFRIPDHGVINALRWTPHPFGADLREALPPEEVQPLATTFAQAAAAGMDVSVISGAEFTGSGMTRAVLRGGRYVGVHRLGDLAARVQDAIADGGFCYGYHADLDLLGHVYGAGGAAWRMQLRQIDRLVESIVETLPSGGLLAVVADHGMVNIDGDAVVDLDACADLQDGVIAVGGEVRARHVYVADGASAAVAQTWRETLGAKAWVRTKDEAIAEGWFGPRITDAPRSRIGDVVVAARDNAGLVRRTVEPMESALIGQHGSWTDAEQLVPLLVAHA
ncbi:alkaline phosphatase family protein [Mycobacterium sp. CBMA 234]|uniref:alkaline phosphatase family protein n=1 Tax=Mycolicibacterium sp. CBMA 234 TaxID=1918495 RepID=UPI0012DEA352|nr:alkaline phosphatase family protein [Mycolicibacterium sp. CBMA 234]MUL62894.1 alkaline phosphatase family protein [Mycolicibacterium sp. CBMA 234]